MVTSFVQSCSAGQRMPTARLQTSASSYLDSLCHAQKVGMSSQIQVLSLTICVTFVLNVDLGLYGCVRAFSTCGKSGRCVGFSLWWFLLLCSVGPRLWVQQLWHSNSCPGGMWDLPAPGIEPVSPISAGGFLTVDHQGSP